MALPLMPKATAVWLVDNTALTFEQIAEFTGMHALEIQAIADEEVAIGIVGSDPIKAGELTQDEITRCEADTSARLKMAKRKNPLPKQRSKGARYTPVSKRQDRPNAIVWLLKHHPELSDAQVSKLIGTTKPTINAVRDRSHWNSQNLKAQNPVTLGLCSEADLEKQVVVASRRAAARGETPKPVDVEPEVEEETPKQEPTPSFLDPASVKPREEEPLKDPFAPKDS